MLLFSTVLEINETLTKEDFIGLVIKWNQGSPHSENVIPDLVWNGERNKRYGDDAMWLEIQEYRNRNIIAIRYEKTEEDGVVWNTDFVMNFDSMKMAIQLDRSFLADSLTIDPTFSTPYFITLLSDGGYLKPDDDLPVSTRPQFIKNDNLDLLGKIINGEKWYRLPIVYISKTRYNTDPVEIWDLAKSLKGVAHVLVQEKKQTNDQIRRMCDDQNEFYGAVGIYFPNPAVPHKKFMYRGYSEVDELLHERVVLAVISYSNLQNVDPLFTWQGVNNALLRDRWASRGDDIIALERAKDKALQEQEMAERARAEAEQEKNEAHQLVDSTDEEIAQMRRQIEALTHENERLTAENTGLRNKLTGMSSVPVIFQGNEDDFFPGEIKDLILSALERYANELSSKTRRKDVLLDIIQTNDYQRVLSAREEELKNQMRGYSTMSKSLRQYLNEIGFKVIDGGKHYRLEYFGDHRYHITVAKTGSDHREGLNTASTIAQTAF